MAVFELAPIRIDAERARAYVLAHGGLREKARLAGIFGATGPDREVVKALEALQNPDGGFPLRQEADAPSSVDTTCYILQQLKDLPPLAGSPMASRAVSFLRRFQLTDGSWEEPGGGTGRETAYLTANATYTILSLEPEHLDPVLRAEGWLRRNLAGVEPGAAEQPATETLALTWGVWLKLAAPRTSELAWAFAQLERQELEAPELAWWLTIALEAGAGGRFLLPIARLLARLAAMQDAETGGWPAEPGFETESTLAALRVFRGYGIIQGG